MGAAIVPSVTFVRSIEDVVNSFAIWVLYELVFLYEAVSGTITGITFSYSLAPFLEISKTDCRVNEYCH